MPVAPLANIRIEDKDIDEVEKLLGNVTFDEPRRAVIKNLDTFDIQAFPGSGKTTLLVAKLAILAKKWSYANKGICVLSHTNVAREEIETRLGTTEVGRKLLAYPHYVGTLHSFCDTFVGLPWLRSKGVKITTIDTEMTLNRRWAKLAHNTRSYLERKWLSERACESLDFPVKLDIGCKETAPSYVNVQKCVRQSFNDGYFTFDEMLYIARYALKQLPSLPRSIQGRFPILLIDEAQDTSALQWEIIDAAFPDETLSIVNSFGDCNQAIFQSYAGQEQNSVFPRKTVATVENSKRFSDKVAQLANPLSVVSSKMTGECESFTKNDPEHTVFLFDRQNITYVLPAYAEHILKCFTDDELCDNGLCGCHAVGMVHNKDLADKDDPHFPVSMIDYWNKYNPSISGRTPNPRHLIEYFRMGESLQAQTHEISKLIEIVSRGLRRYINMNSTLHIPPSPNAFSSILSRVPIGEHASFRSLFKAIIEMPTSTEKEWHAIVAKIRELIDGHFDISSLGGNIFLWLPPEKFAEADTERAAQRHNNYNYTDPKTGRSVDICLGSIHSVKGRTHLSTLVVETFWNNHNIKSILPWLIANPPSKKCGVQNKMRLKCHYVALTRAKGLVCIALPKDLVDEEDFVKLKVAGWNITVIT